MAIQVKTLDQLKTMRRAGLVVAEIHKAIREAIKPGMTTTLDIRTRSRSVLQYLAKPVQKAFSGALHER